MIVGNLNVADSFWSRLKGLMRKRDMPEDEGLLIVPCNSVHSMFMRFPIDLLFLDRELKVIKIVEMFRPWKTTPIIRGSYQVVELRAGVVSKKGVSIKDELEIVNYNSKV
ncbi:DUF192 domain-containing protein [Pelotomaculum propionicicum]|uniref:DUF192 domain-containing protein n=1 Tax=Pelotomaculum propionicicum TaxID=258475 RepID=UPI003B768B91